MSKPTEPPVCAARAPTDPAIARHDLGVQLRKLREFRSLRLDQVAAHLGIVPSSLSRIETGQAPTKGSYLKLMLDLYDVTDPGQVSQLTDLAFASERKPRWADCHDVLPAGTSHYLSLETAASQICCYSGQALPDLIHTGAYAAAASKAARPDLRAGKVGKLVTLLLDRQEILGRTGHQVHVIIDEPALLRPLAPAQIITGQLRHLLALTGESSLKLQVVSPAAEPPVLSPPFTLLGFPDQARPDIGCYHGPAGQIAATRRAADVQAMHATFDALTRTALSPAATVGLIKDLAAAESFGLRVTSWLPMS